MTEKKPISFFGEGGWRYIWIGAAIMISGMLFLLFFMPRATSGMDVVAFLASWNRNILVFAITAIIGLPINLYGIYLIFLKKKEETDQVVKE